MLKLLKFYLTTVREDWLRKSSHKNVAGFLWKVCMFSEEFFAARDAGQSPCKFKLKGQMVYFTPWYYGVSRKRFTLTLVVIYLWLENLLNTIWEWSSPSHFSASYFFVWYTLKDLSFPFFVLVTSITVLVTPQNNGADIDFCPKVTVEIKINEMCTIL